MRAPLTVALAALLLPAAAAAGDPAPSLEGDVMPVPATPETPPAPPELSLVYEGATGGISGASADLGAADSAVAAGLAADEVASWSRLSAGWGAFLQDGRWLLQPDGGVGAFREVVATQVVPAGEPIPVPALLADDYAVFVWPAEAAERVVPLLAAALGDDPLRAPPAVETVGVLPHRAGDIDLLLVGSPGALRPVEAPLDPDSWEARVRTVFVAGDATVHVVSRLQGEGSRRAAMVAAWSDQPHLYLSAGESTEGRSFLQGQTLDLQRPVTWATWKELGLDALAPGRLELIAGADSLRAEADAAGVRLLSSNLVDADGEPVFEPYALLEAGGRRVAVIGWTDPAALLQLAPAVRSGMTARGAPAVHDALTKLAQDPGGWPDLVVLLGVGSRELAGHLPGVDIVLGEFSTRLRLARVLTIDEAAMRARADEHPRARAPVLVSRLGSQYVGRIDLSFADGQLSSLRHTRALVGEQLPAAPAQVRQVQAIRQGVYASLEDVLVPDLATLQLKARAGHPAPAVDLDPGAFTRLTANLLMDRTGADLALLRPLRSPVDVPGPTRSLYVDASLSLSDEVSVIELSGLQLHRLLTLIQPIPPTPVVPGYGAPEEDSGEWAWSAGVKTVITSKGLLKVTVRGRVLQNDDIVYLATTDFFDRDPRVITIVGKARVWRHFAGEGWVRRKTGSGPGDPWLLHDLVKDGLVALRDADPSFGARYEHLVTPALREQSGVRSGRLTLEFDQISLQVTGSKSVGDRAGYEASQESRVNQVDSVNTSLRGRIALVWDDRIGQVLGYGEGAFGRSDIADVEDPIELEDDLEFGGQASLHIVRIPAIAGQIPLSAFVQGAFDTEFTAGDDGAGDKLPLQRIARGTTGVNFGKYLVFKELKAGFFLEYDFSAEVGPLAPGVNIFGRMERLFGPVRWTGLLDFKGYFPTAVDTPEDLAFTLQLRTDLAVVPLKRLIPGLAVGGFVDALIFRGKLDSNDHAGMHLLLGAALTYDADLRPPLRLR